MVDLRSDTVTKPTPEMRRAMADAEVGDDGYREDPTVRALEEAYAGRVGKPSALYVPSGTMANQVVLRVLAAPGTAVVAGRWSHVVAYEQGAAARNASVQFQITDDAAGAFTASEVEAARGAALYHQPPVSLVCLENSHMAAGGVPWDLESLHEVSEAAGTVALHMDGARLFNAAVASDVPASQLAAPVTTVMTCLSKGLCAPVGSLLAGPEDFIEAARLERKLLGGAMRQAGVIAAAGLVALETMIERLAEDHVRARRLAEVIADRWPDAGCDAAAVRTNIVVFRPPDATKLVEYLRGEGVLAGTIAPGVARLVTHHDVGDRDLDHAISALAGAP